MNALPDNAGSAPPGSPPCSVVYEINHTAEYVVGLWRHWRQSKHRSRLFMRIFRVVAGLILTGLIVLTVAVGRGQHWFLTAALLVILGVLVFSEQIDGWVVVRRWRKALSRDKQTKISFTSDGMSAVSDFGQGFRKWAAFTVALRYPAGFLIFSGPYLPYWLPDADLVQGTPDDAAALFKAHVPDYKQA